jgi:hypothetical protein
MKSIVVKVEPGVPPPSGGVFKLTAWRVESHAIHSAVLALVDTGLTFKLGQDMRLDVDGVGCMIAGHSFDVHGRLKVLVFGKGFEEGAVFAIAEVVDREPAKVRFMMGGEGGGRLVFAGEKEIESSNTGRVAKP